MNLRALAAASATAALIVTGAGAAAAQPGGFGACSGVSDRGHGRYTLTADAACDLALLGNGAKVDLAHHTLSTSSVVEADRVTLINGNLRSDGIFWSGSHGRMEDLDVTQIGADPAGSLIEAGPDFTVTRSRFHDLPSSTAVDFYFGNGTVSHSTFRRTGVGVSVQSSAGVTIRDNMFSANDIGVQLWNEDFVLVNDVTVSGNTITDSRGPGIRLFDTEGEFPGTFDNVRVTNNHVARSGGSGIDVTVKCLDASTCPATGVSIVVERNVLDHNGYSPGEGNDGLTARASTFEDVSMVAPLAILRAAKNVTTRNADRGIDAAGVTDGGGNLSRSDRNPVPCLGVTCRVSR